MAEYIDIARIDDWNDLSIIDDNGCAIYVDNISELTKADVIEREKIDKAIEEMTQEFEGYDYNQVTASAFAMKKAIAILQKHIEGSEE